MARRKRAKGIRDPKQCRICHRVSEAYTFAPACEFCRLDLDALYRTYIEAAALFPSVKSLPLGQFIEKLWLNMQKKAG